MATSTPRYFGPATWEDLPDYVYPSGGLLRPYNDALQLPTGLLRMSVCRLLPGQDVEHHRHYTMSEIYFLMQGHAQFRIDDQIIEAEERTAVFFPPEPMRSVYNHSDEEAWWLFVGAPPDVAPDQPPRPELGSLAVSPVPPPADPRRYYGPARWADLPDHVYLSGGLLRPFNDALNLRSGLLRMSVCRLLPGQDVGHHRHYTMSEIYFLVKGHSQFRIDEQIIEADEHTAVFFPPETMRSVYNNSDEEAWWLFVGAPPDIAPRE